MEPYCKVPKLVADWDARALNSEPRPTHPYLIRVNKCGHSRRRCMATSTDKAASPVRLTIVGPEGSGKTVLGAVLVDFVERNTQCGMFMRSLDFSTRNYCAQMIDTIKSGGWPDSTRPGDAWELRWEWGVGRRLSDVQWQPVTLVDPAGQDVRTEMTGQGSGRELATRIDDSEILLLTVDVEGHYNLPLGQRRESEWIIEKVLRIFGDSPDTKRLLIVATKADQIGAAGELSVRDWESPAAVIDVVKKWMSECRMDLYMPVLTHPNCAVLAVAAALVEPRSTEDGVRHMPRQPHESRGIEALAARLVEAFRAQQQARIREDRRRRARELWGKVKGLGALPWSEVIRVATRWRA